MPIRIDASELLTILEHTPPDQNILLVGRHGIGKSQILTRAYGERGMAVIPLFLGQMADPGDLIGLFHKDEASGRSVFLPPWWWPLDGQPIVLFLDELNRARPELLQAVQDLALNRCLAGKRLPEGSVLISAVNEGEEYQLTDLDPALLSRFNVYEFAPTAEDWLLWAGRQNLDPRVIRFIQNHPEHLDGKGGETDAFSGGLNRSPDRRSWARVSDVVERLPRLEKLHIKLIAGVVGVPAALAFERSLAEAPIVSADDVLLRWSETSKVVKALGVADIVLLNEALALRLATASFPATEAESARANLLAYLKLLKKEKKQEAIAHFASLLEQPRYARAMGFTAVSMALTHFLIEYIQELKI